MNYNFIRQVANYIYAAFILLTICLWFFASDRTFNYWAFLSMVWIGIYLTFHLIDIKKENIAIHKEIIEMRYELKMIRYEQSKKDLNGSNNVKGQTEDSEKEIDEKGLDNLKE